MADLQGLVDQVKHSKDWLTRRRAIIQLSHKKDPSLYPLFLKALFDPVSEVRHASVIALARLGDKRAVPSLSKPRFLQSPDPNMRWMTVRALGELGDYHVIDLLVPLVDDEEWLVRNEAIAVLRQKVEDIVQKGEPSLARILIRMLTLDEPSITEIAIAGLVNMERSSRTLLLESLKSINDLVRQNVLRVLGEARDSEAVPYIIEMLKDSHPRVRAEAVKALGNIRDERAIPHLIERLWDYNDLVREELIEALVKFGRSIVEALHSELALSRDKNVISTLVLALGRIRDPSSIPILIEQLSSTFYSVRMDAVKALSSFGPQVVPHLLPKLTFNESDISALLKQAREANGNIANRLRAIKALGDLEDHRAISLLKELVTVSDHEVASAAEQALVKVGCAAWGRCGALEVLGRVGDESIVPQVVHSLKDDSPHVRYEAVRALGRLKGKSAIPELERVAKSDPVPEVKTEALRVLRELEPGSNSLFELALASIDDPSTRVRLAATRILGDYADERALPYIFEKLSDPSWNVRMSAENALINYGKKVVPVLLERLAKEPVAGSCRMISALARLRDEKAIEPLEQLQAEFEKKDERLAMIAKEALTILKGQTARNALDLSLPLC